MAATKDQMGAATTGMDYGAKGQFMSALQGPGGSPAPQPQGTPPPAGVGVPPGPNDPMGMLLSGAVAPTTQEPLTSGLSVGPGPGPTVAPTVPDDVVERLRLVAMHAKTPVLRAMARAAILRRQKSSGAW